MHNFEKSIFFTVHVQLVGWINGVYFTNVWYLSLS